MRSATAQSVQPLQGHTEALSQRLGQQHQRAREPGKDFEFAGASNNFHCWLRHSMTVAGQDNFVPDRRYKTSTVPDSQEDLLLRTEAQKGKRNRTLLVAGRHTVVVRQQHSQAA
jgi:hypothetical protein